MLKKLVCALLASMMLLGSLASCGETQETPGGSESGSGNAGNESVAETREELEVPDTKYTGKTLTFLTRDEDEWTTVEIFSERDSSEADNISNAVFERNDRILQLYGVEIAELKKTTGEHSNAVTTETSAPTGDFQAIISNCTTSASLASQGKLWNLNSDSIEFIDLSKSWWDGNMAEGMSINNRLYFATGDLLTADNDATFVILFNKKLVEDCKIPDLYAAVSNNEWTMDTFYEYAQLARQDNDGDGKLSYNTDVCGFAYTGDAPECLLFGGGITLCKKDGDDIPYYDLDVERAQNIADKCKLIFSSEHTVNMQDAVNETGINIMPIGQTCFGENHSLFFGEVMQSVTRMRGFDVDFGILPFPKYDTAQSSFYSMMHTTANVVSIPTSVDGDDLVMVNSMIEAMAYYSVDTLTEQYYEINLKTKGAKDEKSGPMMDLILANRVCDIAYYYSLGSDAITKVSDTLLPSSSKSVSSLNQQLSSRIKSEINNLIKKMDKYDA